MSFRTEEIRQDYIEKTTVRRNNSRRNRGLLSIEMLNKSAKVPSKTTFTFKEILGDRISDLTIRRRPVIAIA